MTCRIRETAAGASFVCECDCTGKWEPLAEVKEAENDFSSWNYRHALGGLTLTCTTCQTDYVLGGQVEGHGLPDLIEGEELGRVPRVELTRLQRRALDISLTVEETLWQKSMDLVAAANAAGDPDHGEALWEAAKLIRGVLHREKRGTIREILLEHGIDGVPTSLRIARTSDGLGAIYNVTRGELPMPKKELEPEAIRTVDLGEWTSKHDDEDAELPQVFVRVLDLG